MGVIILLHFNITTIKTNIGASRNAGVVPGIIPHDPGCLCILHNPVPSGSEALAVVALPVARGLHAALSGGTGAATALLFALPVALL